MPIKSIVIIREEEPDFSDGATRYKRVVKEVKTMTNPAFERWTMAEMIGYEPITTFWQDFSIADAFGDEAIKDTFNRAFKEWKSDYKFLTELVMVLNHKMWKYHRSGNTERSIVYQKLFETSRDYAIKNLKGDELSYYLRVTD